MEFRRRNMVGGWVEPPPGMTADALRPHLPKKLAARPECEAFLAAVVESASMFYSMYPMERKLTSAEIRNSIESLERAAHDLQNAIHRFSGGDSDEFDCMNAHFEHLVIRNNESGLPTEGRPVVPGLPHATPGLDELLARLHNDLTALRAGCAYCANLMQPARNLAKYRERELVTAVAKRYLEHFGKPPPVRGAFAPFVKKVGTYLKLEIGSAVTKAAVESLEARSD